MILDGKITIIAMSRLQPIDTISYREGEKEIFDKFVNDYKDFADQFILTFKIVGREDPIRIVATNKKLGRA